MLKRTSALGSLLIAFLWLTLPSARAQDASPKPSALVVHFGDSFVNSGLQQALRPKFRAENTRFVAMGQTKAFLSDWAFGQKLDGIYYAFRPQLFLITLGANDLLFRPAYRKANQVHSIVKKLRGTPCVWIGTPLWEGAPDDFVEMIRRESAPCRHFDSQTLAKQITRQKDKRHPDDPGGALWADAFWSWLQKERDPSQGPWGLKPAPPEEHGPRPSASGSAASVAPVAPVGSVAGP